MSQQSNQTQNFPSIQSFSSKDDHQFFSTLKRYAQRLNEQKNNSLNYLQTINYLTLKLTKKQQEIQKLTKQNIQLKEKLGVYESVMINGSKIIPSKNNQQNELKPLRMSHISIQNVIGKQKFTESILQLRNQLQYQSQFKDYNNEKEKLEKNLNINDKQFLIFGQLLGSTSSPQVHSPVRFPIFEEFIIIKPSQNANISPQNIKDMKLIFTLSQFFQKNSKSSNQTNISSNANNKQQLLKKFPKQIYESILTYLCHNNWIPQEYPKEFLPGLNDKNSAFSSESNNEQNSQNQFIIYLSKSAEEQQSYQSKSRTISQIYDTFNPSLYYFGISIKSFVIEEINGKYYKIPIVYCFITRYPIVEWFKKILLKIKNNLNFQNKQNLFCLKQDLLKLQSITQDKMFLERQLRFNLWNEEMRFYSPLILEEFFISPQFRNIIRRKQKSVTVQYNPKQEQQFLSSLILTELLPIFNQYNIQLIIDVLLLLLLQIPITIVSRNQELLTKFMLYFIYIINPLKYPFPVVFNLPQNMSVLLESPFPSFIGISNPKMIEPYIFERAVFDLDQKIAKSWPNISFYNASRDSVIKWLNKQMGNQINIEKINDVVKILLNSSKYFPEQLKQLKIFRKYFKKTQIWNIYIHQKNSLTNS